MERIHRITREDFEELPAVRRQNEVPCNRHTALLTCLCLLCIHNPHWGIDRIARHLSSSFPETLIHGRDVGTLFSATYRNRREWVRDMGQKYDSQQALIGERLQLVLQAHWLRHAQIPRDYDRRATIRYLWDLVFVSPEDRD